MHYTKLKAVIGLIFLLNGFLSTAQQAQVQYGKNRIQYKDFNWKYISTYNFDIYYYDGAEQIARNAAMYAETDFKKIVEETGFSPYSKTKLLVYSSVSDLQQSNIGLEDGIVVGGQTNFIKSKIEVAFAGNQNQFRKDIRFGISEMMINLMLYGGSLKDIVQSSYLMSLPDWYVSGAAAYISEGWNGEMDNYARDMFVNGKFRKPSLLNGSEAILAGHSIWNFIAEKYGKQNIPNILNLTRIVRTEEASIESALGIPYSVFVKEWVSYYSKMTNDLAAEYEYANEDNKISKRNGRNFKYKHVGISPNGSTSSFIKSYNGKYNVTVHSQETAKRKRIHKGGQKLLRQKDDSRVIQSAWQSEDVLAFIEKKRNKIWLNFYNVKTGKNSKRRITEFNQVLSFSFSKDGQKMILSADKNGQSDIFIYELSSNSFRQITNDLYDDIDPAFLPDNKSFVFSSNRISDTLSKTPGHYKEIGDFYNIFICPTIGKGNVVLKRITTFGMNKKPLSLGANHIVYLSNKKGIFNIYKYSISAGTTIQSTKFIHDVEDFAVHAESNSLVFISVEKGKHYVYRYQNFNFDNSYNPSSTVLQKSIDELFPEKNKQIPVTDSIASDTGNAILNEEININDFQFKSDSKKNEKENKVVSANSKPVGREIGVQGPTSYFNDFAVERVNSTLMIDPLRGLGVLMEGNLADMMGNHRINAGFFGLTDLKSSNVFGEYMYLKKRIDYKARYDRTTIFAIGEAEAQRYTLNKLAVTASYPFSVRSRVSVSPYLMGTRYTNLSPNPTVFALKDGTQTYSGIKGEYVYDNTLVTGMNMIEGTRCRIGIENNFHLSDNSKNFGKLVIDLRRYQPIHREIVLATRLSYGQFFGKSKKSFLLGGMDNWLFNSTSYEGAGNPLVLNTYTDNSDLLFVDYVTNMRGFNYNTQFGPKYVLFNAELRIPIVKYLYKGVINSNFLKNIQFNAFTDIGSSWSGSNPFNQDNSSNTTFVGGGSSPFAAKVINYKNPFLVGYGVGVRTMFLGYYVKFDMAYGMQDRIVQGRKFYLTFGFDF